MTWPVAERLGGFAVHDRASPNQDDRPGRDGVMVDTLILHYTGMQTGQDAIDRLCDAQAKVSSHYVVEEDGTIWRLVPEDRRAYHAGISYWRGRRALNDVSIGIEIVNPGHEWGYRAFPAAQMQAVRLLCQGILSRHPIPSLHVLGHSDVAPNRKQDPGELFDWPGLAAQGIGHWPAGLSEIGASTAGLGDREAAWAEAAAGLARLGYEIPEAAREETLRIALIAFQRHWRQGDIQGHPDRGTLAALREVAGG